LLPGWKPEWKSGKIPLGSVLAMQPIILVPDERRGASV
jgi:hypothetical protein